MKMNETRRVLYDAVSGIDDALVQEATTPMPGRILGTLIRVAAAAAVLALLIGAAVGLPGAEAEYVTGPGLLSIRAYAGEASEEHQEVILKEGIVLPAKFEYRINASVEQVLPITLSIPEDAYPDMDVTFEVTTMDGIFSKSLQYDPNLPMFAPNATWLDKIVGNYYGQHFVVHNNTKMNWAPWGLNYDYVVQELRNGVDFLDIDERKSQSFFSNNPSYIDIIIRAEDHIVGYAVIEIREVNDVLGPFASDFTIEVLKIVSFPATNGKLQKVSEEYVQNQISSIKTDTIAK